MSSSGDACSLTKEKSRVINGTAGEPFGGTSGGTSRGMVELSLVQAGGGGSSTGLMVVVVIAVVDGDGSRFILSIVVNDIKSKVSI